MKRVFAPICVAWMLCISINVWAQDRDLFRITGVTVDREAATAATARLQGLAQARQQAFRKLINRLVVAADRERAWIASDSDLATLVRGIEIEDERFSSTRYLASVTVLFDPAGVQRLFRDRDIAFSLAQARPVLPLGIISLSGTDILFEHPNAWHTVLTTAAEENRLRNYRPLEPSPKDRLRLPAGRVIAGDQASLTRFAAEQEVDRLLIAQVTRQKNQPNGLDRLALSYRFWPDGQPETLVRLLPPGSQPADQYQTMARQLFAKLDAQWQQRTAIRSRLDRHLLVRVATAQFTDWLTVKQRLERVPLIRATAIRSIGLPVSRFDLQYLGELDQLRLSLTEFGLVLHEGADGYAIGLAE